MSDCQVSSRIFKRLVLLRALYLCTYDNSGRVPRRASQVSGCTAWVKRWSEAMDFLQTIFKTNRPVVTESKGMQETPEFDAKYDPVVT